MKKQSGITLIALVITIIVLLILAGVSIASIVGENGIINKAREAQRATAEAVAREILSRDLLDLQTNYVTQGKSLKISQEMADDLEKYSDIDSVTYTEKAIKVVIGEFTFDITDNLVIGGNIAADEIVEPENINDWKVDYDTKPGYAIIIGYAGNESSIVIPNEIDGVKVVQVGNGSSILEIKEDPSEYSYEYGNDNIITKVPVTKVVISEGIEIIEDYAFQNATVLNTVVLPASLETIGKYAFSNSGLTNITIPSGVKTIETYAFYNCSNLRTVILNEGLEKIEDGAFSNCPITNVVIPDTVTTLGSYTFTRGNITIRNAPIDIDRNTFGTANIIIADNSTRYSQDEYCLFNKDKTMLYYFKGDATEYIMPDTVTTIAESAFYNSSLISIELSDNLKTIPKNCFSGSDLEHVVIPSGVTEIGNGAFSSCSNLQSVFIPSSVVTIKEIPGGNLRAESLFNRGIMYCEYDNLTVYCEAESKPSGWVDSWNYGCITLTLGTWTTMNTQWGVTLEEYNSIVNP